MTIEELVEEYLTFTVLRSASERCYQDTTRLCRRLMPARLCDDIILIQDVDLIQLRKKVLRSQTPISFNTHRNRLRTMFRFAIQRGIINSNPTDSVTLAPNQHSPHKTLSPNSIQRIVDYLKQEPGDKARFWLYVTYTLYWTGIRRRQLTGLKWQDIDWDDQSIRLSAESSKTRKEWVIPMTARLEQVLQELLGWTTEVLGSKPKLENQVFDLKLFTGQKMHPYQVTYFYWRLSDKLGFKISPHRFRHTLATELANSVPNIKIVQTILGHADVKTTCGYIQPDRASMLAAMSKARSFEPGTPQGTA